jgi:tRNA(Ile)-lysidine synthase
MAHPLIQKVRKAGREQGWIDSTETMMVAVSGGGDSVALLDALEETYHGRIIVAHLEHGIRGTSSVADADFVRDLCQKKNLDVVIRSVSIPRQRHRGESMEEAARRIRYKFLEGARDSFGAAWIAVGHNSDDVVETMLLNFLRGTGVSGLCGLLGRRGRIVRPLIHCSRLDLRNFLLEHGQTWREDETNSDTRYLRNKLRLELIPSLTQAYNPNFSEKMLFLRESLIPCREFLEERGKGASLLLRRNLPLAICAWDLHSLRRLVPSARADLFRYEASGFGLGTLDHRQMERLLGLLSLRQGWRFQWEKTLEIRAGGGFLALLDRKLFDRPPDPPFVLDETKGKTRWGAGTLKWETTGLRNPAFSDFSVVLPAFGKAPVIMSSSEALPQATLGSIPWFYRKCWPTVVFGDKMSWTPFWGRPYEFQETDSFCIRLTYTPDRSVGES